MTKCEIIKIENLSQSDEAKWNEFRAAQELFISPLLSPEFVREVARVRDDVRVAIYRENDAAIAFLAFHQRPNNFARPVGAPFSDYSAMICGADCTLRMQQALRLANISKFRAIGFIDPYNLCDDFGGEIDEAHVQKLDVEDYENSVGKKHRKNVNRLRRHMVEELGEVDFIFDDTNQDHYDEMIKLKREQCIKTGIHDFLSPSWVQKLMQNLWNAPRDGIHGSLLTMTAGGKPIAWQFGPRLGPRMHPWIFAYRTEYAHLSPGQIYLMDCPHALKSHGILANDLSTGSQSYKATFCNHGFNVRHGNISADGTKDIPLNGKIGNLVHRFSRRLDQIACLELDFGARFNGTIFALKSASKRV